MGRRGEETPDCHLHSPQSRVILTRTGERFTRYRRASRSKSSISWPPSRSRTICPPQPRCRDLSVRQSYAAHGDVDASGRTEERALPNSPTKMAAAVTRAGIRLTHRKRVCRYLNPLPDYRCPPSAWLSRRSRQ